MNPKGNDASDSKNITVTELKERGNECVRAGNYEEAVIHYSHGIKLDPSSPQLYSNRSLTFLKLKHFYYALQDAKEAIRLDPSWAKGYYRQGEVEFATQHFEEALESYRRASQLHADSTLLECVIRSNKELLRQQKVDKQMPWVAAGIGMIIGVLLVVGDAAIAKSPVLTHPVLQALMAMVFSLLGLLLGHCYHWYNINQRKALLEPPVDLLGGEADDAMPQETEEETVANGPAGERKQHVRYSKAQARQRYKKGKS